MRILILSLLFISNVFALPTEQELSICEQEAAKFGDGTGKDKISQMCFSHFKKMSLVHASEECLDGKYQVIGHRNLVFIDHKNNSYSLKEVIAGSSTELKEVVAIALDEKNKEIAVLEKNGDILFFSSVIMGNVAPLRILRLKELEGATDIAIDSKRNRIIVLNKKSESLLFYSRLGNIHGFQGKKNLSLQKSIAKLPSSTESIAINPMKEELYTLDSKGPKVWIYDLNKSKSKEFLPVPKTDSIPVKLGVSGEKVVITVKSGDTFKLPRK